MQKYKNRLVNDGGASFGSCPKIGEFLGNSTILPQTAKLLSDFEL